MKRLFSSMRMRIVCSSYFLSHLSHLSGCTQLESPRHRSRFTLSQYQSPRPLVKVLNPSSLESKNYLRIHLRRSSPHNNRLNCPIISYSSIHTPAATILTPALLSITRHSTVLPCTLESRFWPIIPLWLRDHGLATRQRFNSFHTLRALD